MKVTTPRCSYCGASGELEVPEEGHRQWKAGALIQDVLPDLTADEREMLISGTHPRCFDALFPPETDEDGKPICDGPCVGIGVGTLHHPDCSVSRFAGQS